MTKRTKVLLSILLVALFAFSGCTTIPFTPLKGNTAYSSVISNGGTIVEAGDYTYFVNGIVPYNVDNVYGEVVKGSVARAKTSTIGTDNELVEILAPRAVYYTTGNGIEGGLYIFNNRLYYTSTSVNTDKEGSRLLSSLDIFSCKLDGSDSKLHYTLTSSSPSLMFKEVDGKVFVSYVREQELFFVEITAANPSEQTTEIEDIDNFQYDSENKILYYTRIEYEEYKDINGDKLQAKYNKIYSYDRQGSTFNTAVVWNGYSADQLNLIKATLITAKQGNIIFSTASLAGSTQTLIIKKGSTIPQVISNDTKTAVYYYNDYIYESTTINGVTWITKRQIGAGSYILLAYHSGTIEKVTDDWVYYSSGSVLYRAANAVNTPVKEYEKVTTSTLSTGLGGYEFIGDRIYFIDNSHSIIGYMYYVTIENGNVVKDEDDEIVETRLAILTEDDIETEKDS